MRAAGRRRAPRAASAASAVVLAAVATACGASASAPGAPTAPTEAGAVAGTAWCDGVVVVVDGGGPASGDVTIGCAPGDPATGLAALSAAGHAVDMLNREPRFVCRIDGHPADDPCAGFPPPDAYWSSWTVRDGAWTYAALGAAATDPGPGDVEGWAFGAGDPPRADPAALTGTAAP